MIRPDELEACAEQLYTYDVIQGAWEQEPNGFEVNAHHVLTHLAKDLVAKDFSNAEVVRDQIAPDALQYAIRLGRWSGVAASDLVPGPSGTRWIASAVASKLGDNIPLHMAAHAEAAGGLARNLHDLGHASLRQEATAGRADSMRAVGRTLIVCAEAVSEIYSFDPVEAFVNRLAQLRQRFGIPEPTHT